jgi:acetyl-CoA decarbonylase/synthase complex subunit gamma
MAFAMKLAAKKAELSQCPYASDEAKRVIGAASEPPVKGIELGKDNSVKLGEETVLYRHEKTFVHPPAIAIMLSDNDTPESITKTLQAIGNYTLERAGQQARVDMIAINHQTADGQKFVELAKLAWETLHRPLILRSKDPKVLEQAAIAVKGSRSVLASATPETLNILKSIAEANGHALAVTASDLESLAKSTENLKASQFDNLLLEFNPQSVAETFVFNSIARRAALKDTFKPFGYPSLHFLDQKTDLEDNILAITEIAKYGGIIVFPTFDPAQLTVMFTLRMGIYTDPQKPIQVEPKLYSIGEPTPDSLVFVTTNFSLTFFLVSGEIENTGISAWLVVPECEGMSVLTAWAAGKFTGHTIAKFIKEKNIEGTVRTRNLIIPGYVAQISGELEDNLPGWKVLVGPQDAADIDGYVKTLKNS